MLSETTLEKPAAKRTLADAYQKVRARTEGLCVPLQPEDYVVQVEAFTSPAKWHLAHTTWFFETFVLLPHFAGYREYHPEFGFLFNSYYNNAGDRVLRANRGNLSRPTVEEVYAYRKHVDEGMQHLLEQEPSDVVRELVTLGLNHEQQHQELLVTDLKYMFGHNPLFPAYAADASIVDRKQGSEDGFLAIVEGMHDIGFRGQGFCYDNELGVHQVFLNRFELSRALVTNGEYLEFMEAGGYSDFNLWLDEGWSWVQEYGIKAPLYWHSIDGTWHHYTLQGLRKVEPNGILKHISFYEAMAFAEWKGMRLPTEFEWEAAADKLDWGQRWEWTASAYLPYPNFKKAEGAIGEYNGKFMVNQQVLRGASVATAEGHSRPSYRNFFHADERWQFTGIRLAR